MFSDCTLCARLALTRVVVQIKVFIVGRVDVRRGLCRVLLCSNLDCARKVLIPQEEEEGHP